MITKRGNIKNEKPAPRKRVMRGPSKVVAPRDASASIEPNPVRFFASFALARLELFPSDPRDVPTISYKKKVVRAGIPVVATFHHPSPHLLSLRPQVDSPALSTVLHVVAHERRWAKWYILLNEISLFSAVGFVFWGVTKSAAFLFRLPSAVFGLPDFTRFPQLALQTLPRARTLKTLTVDRVSRVVKKQQAWVRERFSPEELTAPLWPKLVSFAFTAAVFVLPFFGVQSVLKLQAVRAEALDAAASGMHSFVEAGTLALGANYAAAADQFSISRDYFSEGAAEINRIPAVLRAMVSVLPRGSQIEAAQNLLTAAEAFSVAGQKLAEVAEAMGGTSAIPHSSPAERWQTLATLTGTLALELERAQKALARVHPADIPDTYRVQYREVIEQVEPALAAAVYELKLLKSAVPDLLGLTGPRRYLVVFQNNHELRATGGFMGSFALVDVRGGEIQKYTVPGGGTYDLQGSLVKRVAAPEPLQLINARWEFQDANWWWDWPTSAQKIEWFYSHAGGETVDGVIAVDASVVESLLTLTGPIAVPEYGLTISAENFVQETTAEVEQRYDKELNQPKKFLADFTPRLLERLTSVSERDGGDLLTLIGKAVAEKHIQIYRHDEEAERVVRELGWGGNVKSLPPLTDTLGVVHTNIAGGKTDALVDTRITHHAEVDATGVIIDTVEITRTHRGVKGSAFTGVRNVDYVRVYVPEGSELISGEGFTPPPDDLFDTPDETLAEDEDLRRVETRVSVDAASGVRIAHEFNRTSFGHWMMTDPGTTTTVQLTYRLPWRLTSRASTDNSWAAYLSGEKAEDYFYRLFWEKQPGTFSTTLSHSFRAPAVTVSEAPVGTQVTPRGWSLEKALEKDAHFTWKFRP